MWWLKTKFRMIILWGTPLHGQVRVDAVGFTEIGVMLKTTQYLPRALQTAAISWSIPLKIQLCTGQSVYQ